MTATKSVAQSVSVENDGLMFEGENPHITNLRLRRIQGRLVAGMLFSSAAALAGAGVAVAGFVAEKKAEIVAFDPAGRVYSVTFLRSHPQQPAVPAAPANPQSAR